MDTMFLRERGQNVSLQSADVGGRAFRGRWPSSTSADETSAALTGGYGTPSYSSMRRINNLLLAYASSPYVLYNVAYSVYPFVLVATYYECVMYAVTRRISSARCSLYGHTSLRLPAIGPIHISAYM